MRSPWHSPEFKALWDRIKHRTTYHGAFDNEDLLARCTRALREAPAIPRTRLQWRGAGLAIGRSGVEATESAGAATTLRASAHNRMNQGNERGRSTLAGIS